MVILFPKKFSMDTEECCGNRTHGNRTRFDNLWEGGRAPLQVQGVVQWGCITAPGCNNKGLILVELFVPLRDRTPA